MYYVEQSESGDWFVYSEEDAEDIYGPFDSRGQANNQCEFLNHWGEEEW